MVKISIHKKNTQNAPRICNIHEAWIFGGFGKCEQTHGQTHDSCFINIDVKTPIYRHRLSPGVFREQKGSKWSKNHSFYCHLHTTPDNMTHIHLTILWAEYSLFFFYSLNTIPCFSTSITSTPSHIWESRVNDTMLSAVVHSNSSHLRTFIHENLSLGLLFGPL